MAIMISTAAGLAGLMMLVDHLLGQTGRRIVDKLYRELAVVSECLSPPPLCCIGSQAW